MSVNPHPKRGELYRLKSPPAAKPRVIVIISREPLNGGDAVLAVPFYSQQLEKRRQQEWCEMFYSGEGGLDKDCVAAGDQVTFTDKTLIDLTRRIGKFDAAQLRRVLGAVKWAIGVDPDLDTSRTPLK